MVPRTAYDCLSLTLSNRSYADEAAFEAHKNGEKFNWFVETGKKEDLFAAPLKVCILDPFGGFASRI